MLWTISPAGAVISCLGIASTFVGALYLVPKRIRKLDRDDPQHITARIRISSLTCLLFPTALFLTADRASLPNVSLAEWLGFRTGGLLLASIAPLGLFIALFAGPLATFYYDYKRLLRHRHGNEKTSNPVERVDEFLSNFCPNYPETLHEKMRNLVFAPLTEEFAFRSCMVPLLLCAGLRRKTVILGGPLFFGVAHLHHAVGMVRQGVPWAHAAMSVAFQLLYTSLFGGLEMFVFLRTGHFVAITLVHCWCNLMGLPSVAWMSSRDLNYAHRWKIGLAYLAGIVAFCGGLVPLTSPALYGSRLWELDVRSLSS